MGKSAFAHKAGLHTSAIARRPDAYEHVDPATVGNGTRFLVSISRVAQPGTEGRSSLASRSRRRVGHVLAELKELEHAGYHFEAADASLELL